MNCPGSGGRPAETVILDTIPGVEPSGTCPVCAGSFRLDVYRLPDHPPRTSGPQEESPNRG